MSRVHDALRRAEKPGDGSEPPVAPQERVSEPGKATVAVRELSGAQMQAAESPASSSVEGTESAVAVAPAADPVPAAPHFIRWHGSDLLSAVGTVPFTPDAKSLLLNPAKPHEMPSEEFRTLRTRLNHVQATDGVRSIVVTSPSPAEGKSFTAANLAISESLLENNNVLLLDCDLRRPSAHTMFGLQRTPGVSDYLRGTVELQDCIKRIDGTNLYLMPAGEAVVNPLEVLNLGAMPDLIRELERHFRWTIIDSPPLLFAADANLLATLCSGTILVVRMHTTIVDSIGKAMQSLCENNVLGVVVNGARRGELYSKYTYYGSRYYTTPAEAHS
jgi:receptor protein-tyrosine kinase